MATIKPTHKDPVSDQSTKFEKGFKKTMITSAPGVRLNEVDGLLTEKEQSLKKKIWSLAKMESLVFSDPKLSVVYEEMAENGEEKYGYHYNETIQNMIFNDYVLNSPHYLQKYKMAIPKEKKRRDKSGINQLKKAGAEKMDATGTKLSKPKEVDESSTAGSAGGAAGYTGYAGPSAWSTKGDLSGDFKGKKKKETDPKAKPISTGFALKETNYLTDPQGFEKYVEILNEESDADFILNNSQAYGSVDNMNPENQKIIRKDIETGKWNSNHNIKDGIALQEKAKSKSQQQFMGMVHAVQKGELSPDKVGSGVVKAADSMSDKDAEDFASTKHKGLPDHVDENLGQPDVDYLVKGYEIINSGPNYDPAKSELFRSNLLQMGDTQAQQVSRTIDGILRKMGYNDPQQIMNVQTNFNEEMEINQFIVTVNHDNGTTRIKTSASNEEAAKQKVMNAENCPASAILKVERDNIKEETQTMIQNNGTSMSNQADPIGDQGNEVPMGAQDTGGLNEDMRLLEEINNELTAFSVHHEKLKLMAEEKKTTSQIINKRVTDENPKHFKKDLQHSGTKDIIDVEKQLQWKDQQTDVPKDPQKLGADIEKQEIKSADMKGDEALKNVGDSTNNEGDEVPKRNLTSDEQKEVNLYRNGQHSLNYDNEPGERFVDRMEADQGEFFEIGEKQKKFKAGAETYNKDPQPVQTTEVDKVQFDKNVKQKGDEVAWNERMGLGSNVKLSESMITGRYINALNKRALLEFNLNEVAELSEGVRAKNEIKAEDLFEMDFTGLGNKYLNKSVDKKVLVNEAVAKAIDSHKFYTDGTKVFAMKNSVQNLNEGEIKDKPVISEQEKKMKHLLGYKPQDFVNTKNIIL